jgi:hypothetical protein
LRFDFQRSLDTKFAGDGNPGLAVAEIALRRGMGVPATYLEACRQAADPFVTLGLISRCEADARLDAIGTRLEWLAGDARHRLAEAGLSGLPVVASAHQRDFCEWLGLKVVAAFRPADTASVSEIEQAVEAGSLARVSLVVANLPEGRRTADALAERLRARVVVLENFPALHGGQVSFDQMLAANLAELLRAAAP